MVELARQKNEYTRKEISKQDAISYFKEKDDEYKLELLEDLEEGNITFYTQGNFTDLCRGPHIPNTSFIKSTKLLNIAGAYWRGDENNKQLTRIYGISFPKQKHWTKNIGPPYPNECTYCSLLIIVISCIVNCWLLIIINNYL